MLSRIVHLRFSTIFHNFLFSRYSSFFVITQSLQAKASHFVQSQTESLVYVCPRGCTVHAKLCTVQPRSIHKLVLNLCMPLMCTGIQGRRRMLHRNISYFYQLYRPILYTCSLRSIHKNSFPLEKSKFLLGLNRRVTCICEIFKGLK